MNTADAHVFEYEAVLEREGLGSLDCGTMVSQRGQATRPTAAEDAEAVEAYLTWARDVLETCPFAERGMGVPSPETRRSVWRLHASGLSNSEVQRELGISDRAVKVSIAVTKRESPPPPVVNPWMRSGRDLAEIKRSMRQGNDQEEDLTAKPTRQPVEYSCILLRNDMRIPGVTSAKDHIVPMKGHNDLPMPLMGTPHAGGIDVVFPTVTRGKRFVQVITIPWWNIKQAEHAPEEYEAA